MSAQNNPELKSKFYDYSAQLKNVTVVGSLPDPTAEFGLFVQPMSLLGGDQLASITVMQMFPWFGTLKAKKDEASQMALAKLYVAQDYKLNLYRNVRIEYFNLIKTNKEIFILNKNLELLKVIEKTITNSYIHGTSNSSSGNMNTGNSSSGSQSSSSASGMSSMQNSGNDVNQNSNSSAANNVSAGMNSSTGQSFKDILQIQIEISSLKNRIESLQEKLLIQKANFNSLLNRDLSSDVNLSDSLIIWQEISYESFSDSISNHPMIQMLQSDVNASFSADKMAQKMGLPMIGVGINYSLIKERPGNTNMMNGQDMIMPMVTVTLPIYRNKYNAQIQIETDKGLSAQEQIKNIENSFKVAFLNAQKNKNDALRNKKLSIEQKNISDQILALQLTSYTNGKSDFEEILRTQEAILNYEIDKINAESDYNNAMADLYYLIGM
jgi:outer membrane protein TolC